MLIYINTITLVPSLLPTNKSCWWFLSLKCRHVFYRHFNKGQMVVLSKNKNVFIILHNLKWYCTLWWNTSMLVFIDILTNFLWVKANSYCDTQTLWWIMYSMGWWSSLIYTSAHTYIHCLGVGPLKSISPVNLFSYLIPHCAYICQGLELLEIRV